MPEAIAGAGPKVSGYTEITNGNCENGHGPMDIVDKGLPSEVYRCATCGGSKGELLVAFNSLDSDDYWENEYTKERIKYCMKHRRNNIPRYLRTGGKLPKFKGKKWEARRLAELNMQEEI